MGVVQVDLKDSEDAKEEARPVVELLATYFIDEDVIVLFLENIFPLINVISFTHGVTKNMRSTCWWRRSMFCSPDAATLVVWIHYLSR